MASDPPAIDLRGAGLLGQAFAANRMSPASAFARYSPHRSLTVMACRSWAAARRDRGPLDIAEKLPGFAAGLIGGQSTGVADRKAARLALTIAKLDHI